MPEITFVLFVFRPLLCTAGACSAAAALLLNYIQCGQAVCWASRSPAAHHLCCHHLALLHDASGRVPLPNCRRPDSQLHLHRGRGPLPGCENLGRPSLHPPRAHPSPDIANLCHAHTRAHPCMQHADAMLVFSCVLTDRSAIHGVLRHRPGAASGTLCPPGARLLAVTLLAENCVRNLG